MTDGVLYLSVWLTGIFVIVGSYLGYNVWLTNQLLAKLLDDMEKLMTIVDEINTKLDETIAAVSEQGSALDSLDTFVEGLFDQIKALLEGQVPQAVLDKVAALQAVVSANTPKIQTAMEDNVEE